jgi:SAM-dependent methyltransferase
MANRATKAPSLPVLFHVRRRDWQKQIEDHLHQLCRPCQARDAGLETIRLDPIWKPDPAELAEYVLQVIHNEGQPALIFVSDQICTGAALTDLAAVVRSACLAHSCPNQLISLAGPAEPAALPFLASVSFASCDVELLRGEIERAIARLLLLGAADGHWAELDTSEFVFAPVSSREQLSDCLRLRHRILAQAGLLAELNPGITDCHVDLDADYHDGLAIHFAGVHRQSGCVVATTRLILPHTGVARLLPNRGDLWDAFNCHGNWFHSIIAAELPLATRRKLRDPGWAPLPMLNQVGADQNWKELFERAVVAAELSRFTVDPSFRGFGIAQTMAHMVLAASLELRRETLLAQCLPNHARMYRNYGFEDVTSSISPRATGSSQTLVEWLMASLTQPGRLVEALGWDSELRKLINRDREGLERELGTLWQAPRADDAIPAVPYSPPVIASVRPGSEKTAEWQETFLVGAPDYAPQPCYVLDANFRIVDWNGAFYYLFAQPLQLRIGMHAICFVKSWTNVQEAMERSSKVFESGRNPLLDTEVVFIEHCRYGSIRAQKTAQQLFDAEGDRCLWMISMNVFEWELAELDLFGEIASELEYDTGWDLARVRTRAAFASSPAYREVVSEMAGTLSGHDVLEVYAAPGHLAGEMCRTTGPAALTLHETSTRTLSLLARSNPDLAQARFPSRAIKTEIAAFDDSCSESFDSVVSLWLGFHRDVHRFLAQLERVLRPGGQLLFLAPAPGIDLRALVDYICQDAGVTFDASLRSLLERLERARDEVVPRMLGDRLIRVGLEPLPPIAMASGTLLLCRARKSGGAISIPLAK